MTDREGADRLYLFDLDNTLIENQKLYAESKYAVADAILDELQPERYDTPNEIVDQLIDAEDSDRYGAVGVTKTRFRDSCIHAVYEVAKEPDVDARNADIDGLIEAAEEHGMRPMTGYTPDDILPGARDALTQAEKHGDIAILTKGIPEYQQDKLAGAGMDRYVHHIVDDKDAAAFDTVIGDRDPGHVLKIGDSLKSDIIPALEYGAVAVLVSADPVEESAVWKGEETDQQLSIDDPWMRIDGLEQFEDADDAFRRYVETGDVDVLKAAR